MPHTEWWWIAIVICKVLECKMNLLILWPWTHSQGHSLHQVFFTLWDHSLLCYAVDKQTDKQINRKRDWLENTTHPDRQWQHQWQCHQCSHAIESDTNSVSTICKDTFHCQPHCQLPSECQWQKESNHTNITCALLTSATVSITRVQ